MKRIAVLGMNHGYKFATDLKEIDDAVLVAVAGQGALAKNRAKELEVPLYENYKLLIKSVKLDGVIITLPNRLHKEAVQFCAELGITALVEKPIAATPLEAKEMIKYCEARNVKLLVGHHRRFSAKIKKLRDLIQSGAIGEIVGANLLWVLAKDRPYFDETWRITPGGGPLLINGIHDIDNLRYVTGLSINAVYAVGRNKIRGNEVEDSVSAILEASNGATFNYFLTDGVPAPWSYEFNLKENERYKFYDEDCYHFFGTKGSIAFPSFRMYSYKEEAYGWEHPLILEQGEATHNDPMTAELRHFIAVLKGEEEPVVTGAEGLGTLEVLEAIQTSLKESRRVEVSE